MKIYLKSFLRLCYKAFVSVDTIIISFFNHPKLCYNKLHFSWMQVHVLSNHFYFYILSKSRRGTS